jgi:hypothetical protein
MRNATDEILPLCWCLTWRKSKMKVLHLQQSANRIAFTTQTKPLLCLNLTTFNVHIKQKNEILLLKNPSKTK